MKLIHMIQCRLYTRVNYKWGTMLKEIVQCIVNYIVGGREKSSNPLKLDSLHHTGQPGSPLYVPCGDGEKLNLQHMPGYTRLVLSSV